MRPAERVTFGHYLVSGYDIHRVCDREHARNRNDEWLVVLDGELIGYGRTLSEARIVAHDDRRRRLSRVKVPAE